MKPLRRRQLLTRLGLMAGAWGASRALNTKEQAMPTPSTTTLPWPYTPLDPMETAARTYGLFSKGCMYAVFAGVVGQLQEKLGPPHTLFPLDMMMYGRGGVAGWGSLCGALNGAAALFALLAHTEEERTKFTHELFRWYEQTPLPIYVPAEGSQSGSFPKAVASSVICHISVAHWCKVAGCSFSSPERAERCKRLCSDVAGLTVELLNTNQAQPFVPRYEASPATRQCLACHGSNTSKAPALGQGTCATCHTLPSHHPSKP